MIRLQWFTAIALVACFGVVASAQAADLGVTTSNDVSVSALSEKPLSDYTTTLSASAEAWETTAEAWNTNFDAQSPPASPVPEPGVLNILLGTLAVVGCAGLVRWWNNRF